MPFIRPAQQTYPDWRASMAPGTWKKVGSTMDATANSTKSAALNPAGAGVSATWGNDSTGSSHEGFSAIVNDWCGATYRPENTRLYVCGGGHAGYAGNEVISIDLSAASPAWRIERPPTGWKTSASEGITLDDGLEADKIYSNGDPRAAHTYDLMAWANGALYTVPSAVWLVATEASTPYKVFKFTPGASPTVGDNASYGTWTLEATFSLLTANHNDGSLVYDSTRNYLYAVSGAGRPIEIYDLVGGSWVGRSPTLLTDGALRGLYIASLDLVVYMNHYPSGNFAIYKPSTNTMHTPGASGTAPSATAEFHSAANWVSELGAIVSWAEGGTGFHVLTPPISGDPTTTAWTWSRLEASAANTVTPDPPNGNGNFGRFFYSPQLRCLGVVTATAPGQVFGSAGFGSSGQLNIFAMP